MPSSNSFVVFAAIACIMVSRPCAGAEKKVGQEDWKPPIAEIVGSTNDIVASNGQERLSKHLHTEHILGEFGTAVGNRGGIAAFDPALRPYRTAFPDLGIRPKRILANRKLVLVQSVLSGTHRGQFQDLLPTQRVVRAETLQIHWLINGEIRRSVIFLAPDQLRVQIQDTALRSVFIANDAPTQYETFLGPEVQVTKDLVPTIYRLSALAISSRIAWAAGQPEIAARLLREVRTTEIDRLYAERLQPFSLMLTDSKISLENLMAAGPYIIAQLRFRGQHRAAIGNLSPNNRSINIDFLTIGKVENSRVTSTQSYINQAALLAQLRGS